MMQLIRLNHNYQSLYALYVIPLTCAFLLSGLLRLCRIQIDFVALCVGCVLGVITAFVPEMRAEIKKLWKPSMITFLYCPIFIARLTYGMDAQSVYKSLLQSVIIVGFRNVFALAFGFTMLTLNGSAVNITSVLLISVLFSPHDIPVVSNELEGVKNLEVILQVEAILSTALSLTLFEINVGPRWDWHVILAVCNMMIETILFGTVGGYIGSIVFRHLYNDSFNAVCILLTTSYFMYGMCLAVFGLNGVCASFVAVLFISQEKPSITTEVDGKICTFLNVSLRVVQPAIIIAISAFLMTDVVHHCRYRDAVISFGIFVFAKLIDVIGLMILAPILARFSYGFNFISTVIAFWATRKGPVILILALTLDEHDKIDDLGRSVYFYALVYVFLSYAINERIFRHTVHKFSNIKPSPFRQNNINIGIRYLMEKQAAIVSILRMSRYFSDVSWILINDATKIVSPYTREDSGFEYGLCITSRFMKCPNCNKMVSVEPTKKELASMEREARIRVLKAVRVCCSRHFEVGFLSGEEMRALLQAIDAALDSEELVIKLDTLFPVLRKKRIRGLNAVLHLKYVKDREKAPHSSINKKCFILSHTVAFCTVFYILSVLQLLTIPLYTMSEVEHNQNLGLYAVVVLLYLAFMMEFTVKLLACYEQGVRWGFYDYLSNVYHVIDFAALILNTADVIILTLGLLIPTTLTLVILQRIFRYIRGARSLRLIKLMTIIYLSLLSYIDNKRDKEILYGVSIAKAIVASYEEVVEQLSRLTDNESISSTIKERLISDKLAILEELCVIQRERPWLRVTLETKQAMACTLWTMRKKIVELHSKGFLDQGEYDKLCRVIEERFKVVGNYSNSEQVRPKNIYMEVPWIYYDKEAMDYLYENVTTKVWKPGDVICKPGEMMEGVYIILSGVFKIIYEPCDTYLDLLTSHGMLPVKDLLTSLRFYEEQIDYLMAGNTVGELSVLTKRPTSTWIISYTSCQAFVIPSYFMWKAMQRNLDPINGLSSRLWLYVTRSLVKKVLLQTPHRTSYNLKSHENIHAVLDRMIVFNLEHYTTLSLCELVEEVVLIEGVIVDYYTKDTYTAPCYIPRAVQKIGFPKMSIVAVVERVIPRIAVIPIPNVDPYDLVEKIEINSALATGHRLSMQSKRRYKRRRIEHLLHRKNKSLGSYSHYNYNLNKAAAMSMTYQNNVTGVPTQMWLV